MHSTHFIYGYMGSDIWLRTILIVRKETCCRHIGYCYRLTARVLLYAPSDRQDNTYHGLCYTSRGALARTRNPYNREAYAFKSNECSQANLQDTIHFTNVIKIKTNLQYSNNSLGLLCCITDSSIYVTWK